MDYQERYLDLLQRGLRDIKDDLHEMRTAADARFDRMEAKMDGQRSQMWALTAAVFALVVATVWGLLQFSTGLLTIISRR